MNDKLITIDLAIILLIVSITGASFLSIFFILAIILDFALKWVLCFLLAAVATAYFWKNLFEYVAFVVELNWLEQKLKTLEEVIND